MPTDQHDQLHALQPPDGIRQRVDAKLIPEPGLNQLASGLLGIGNLAWRGSHPSGDGDEPLSAPFWPLTRDYGASILGAGSAIVDQMWCGRPHLAAHIVAATIEQDCRTRDAEQLDEQLCELITRLTNSLWGTGQVRYARDHPHASPFAAGLTLRRHLDAFLYGGVEDPPLLELARCGTTGAGTRLPAIGHLLRAGISRYGRRLELLASAVTSLVGEHRG